jgi:PAS domain S-box-containing protein
MRGDKIAFEEAFHVDLFSGRISLGGNRYVILDSAALGSLRRELVENLGWDAARGVLTRVGYRWGRNDARQLHKHQAWNSDEDWLRAGVSLSCLEGMAKVKLDKIEVDRTDGVLGATGEWIDSFEAEQHLQQYGVGSDSSCWMLEGYASGYATEFLGGEAVCIETCCKSKGNPVCRFDLRNAAAWKGAAGPMQEMLAAVRFSERFDRCLRIISDMGCELEQASLDAVITTDAKGMITSCSQGASEVLGISRAEAIGKNVGTFYVGGDSEVRSIFKRLREQPRFRHYLTELISPSGQKTPIALSASAIRDGAGGLRGMIGVAHNLTEIRRLEDELAKKNRFMANILRDSADAIITMDPDGIVTSWNKGAEGIFGYLANEMIGRSIEILIPPELREARELEWISRRFRAQGAVRSHATERITKDGRRIQVIFTRTAIYDDSGRLVGSSSVVKDVTSVRSLEKQLAQTEHLATLGELSAGLAHEIKNPLAGIKGAIDVIRDSLSDSDPHREILGDVIYEVNRINKIVQDLLSYAKPKPACHSTVDLPALVQRIVTMAQAISKRESLLIEVKQLGEIPEFTGDETQLEQAIMNLVLNAQSALPSGGHIEIVLSYDPDVALVSIEVTDDGIGIPKELLKRIFQPFFTTRTDGTGLGLAICLKNVQYHGGNIEVQSKVGQGTTFFITIPLVCHI